jgi:hypothetical protein
MRLRRILIALALTTGVGIAALQTIPSGAGATPPASPSSAAHHRFAPGSGRSTAAPLPAIVPAPHTERANVVTPGPWTIQSTPSPAGTTFAAFSSVSCLTASFCMAVGELDTATADNVLAEVWNGSAWSIFPVPDAAGAAYGGLSSVSCTDTSWCMAVGSSTVQTGSGASAVSTESTLAEVWNGAAWSVVPSVNASSATGSDNQFNGVSCTAATFCEAVGSGPVNGTGQALIEQWNGSSWSNTSPTAPAGWSGSGLNGVSCPTSTFCQAVGTFNTGTSPNQTTGSLIEGWSGSSWTPESSPGSGATLTGISCTSPTFCMTIGYIYTSPDADDFASDNVSEQWNGSSWSSEPIAQPDAAFGDVALAVDCFGPTSCVAGGWVNTIDDSDNTYAVEGLAWNGSAWTIDNIPQPAVAPSDQGDQWNAVSCVAGHMCMGVGYASTEPDGGAAVTLADSAPIPRPGYDEVASDGGIFAQGSAGFYGSEGGTVLNQPVVGMAEAPDGGGYWLVAADGGVFAKGDAQFYGSEGNIHLNKPIVGMAATPDGGGYWLVASDGGVFAKGDAQFYGSMGGQVLNKPIVGMAATPDGRGYWLVAADGGIFNFGDAAFYGSLGGQILNKPIVGMAATPDGGGYWLVAADGGVFAKGDAQFYGSQGGTVLNKPVVGIAPTADGLGYWLVASDGGIFTHGDAAFGGSEGGTQLNQPAVGMAS